MIRNISFALALLANCVSSSAIFGQEESIEHDAIARIEKQIETLSDELADLKREVNSRFSGDESIQVLTNVIALRGDSRETLAIDLADLPEGQTKRITTDKQGIFVDVTPHRTIAAHEELAVSVPQIQSNENGQFECTFVLMHMAAADAQSAVESFLDQNQLSESQSPKVVFDATTNSVNVQAQRRREVESTVALLRFLDKSPRLVAAKVSIGIQKPGESPMYLSRNVQIIALENQQGSVRVGTESESFEVQVTMRDTRQ